MGVPAQYLSKVDEMYIRARLMNESIHLYSNDEKKYPLVYLIRRLV